MFQKNINNNNNNDNKKKQTINLLIWLIHMLYGRTTKYYCAKSYFQDYSYCLQYYINPAVIGTYNIQGRKCVYCTSATLSYVRNWKFIYLNILATNLFKSLGWLLNTICKCVKILNCQFSSNSYKFNESWLFEIIILLIFLGILEINFF